MNLAIDALQSLVTIMQQTTAEMKNEIIYKFMFLNIQIIHATSMFGLLESQDKADRISYDLGSVNNTFPFHYV